MNRYCSFDFFFTKFDIIIFAKSESDENREMSTNLTEALQIKDRKYDIDEGDGSFCVPQTDTKFKDTIGGKQSSYTFQVNFAGTRFLLNTTYFYGGT